MKYKILINGGNSTLLRDFFTNATGFSCLSTSGYWSDISEHYKLFKPDAYVCIASSADIQIINQIKRLKSDEEFRNVPIVLISNEDCLKFYLSKNEEENIIDIILSRPITIAAILEKTKDRLQQIEKEKQRIALEIQEAQKKAAEEIQKNNAARKKHILIVDDDKTVLKLLKSALEDKYEVTTIAGGRIALRFLENRTPDLIFLDYEMPIENGPSIFKKMRKMENVADVPIVFLTGIADREKITEVLSLKPQGYLLKPIDMKRVNDTIASFL